MPKARTPDQLHATLDVRIHRINLLKSETAEIDGHIESLTKVRKQKQELKLSDKADHIGSQLSSLHQRVGSGWVSTPPRLLALLLSHAIA